MATAIDSNVIVALWSADDRQNLTAQKALEESQARSGLVICGVTFAELMAAPGRTENFVDQFCEAARIAVEWELDEKVWRAAGEAFQSYATRRRKQKEGGPRRTLADFLIGAHAAVKGYKLLTLDEGIYRAAFPKLTIVEI